MILIVLTHFLLNSRGHGLGQRGHGGIDGGDAGGSGRHGRRRHPVEPSTGGHYRRRHGDGDLGGGDDERADAVANAASHVHRSIISRILGSCNSDIAKVWKFNWIMAY